MANGLNLDTDDELFFDPSAEETPPPGQSSEDDRILLEKKREFLERFLAAWQNKKAERKSA